MDNAHKLLHPNLLQNSEIVGLIKERQLNINNVEGLSRSELIEIFKAHIMPKPQRQSKSNQSTNGLAKEVKRIKLNREHSRCDTVEKMEVDDMNVQKRSHSESIQNKPKRQRIQWP